MNRVAASGSSCVDVFAASYSVGATKLGRVSRGNDGKRDDEKATQAVYADGAGARRRCIRSACAGDEEPFWAKGRPHSDAAAKMAPVAAKSIPTSADKLPAGKMKLPPGFKVEVWASNVLDARGLRQGDQGTVFVSSLFVAGKVYAIVDKGGKREVKTIAEKLNLPSGIEFYRGALYVATPKEVIRFDNIEANLDNPPKPIVIYDKLPGDIAYGWKSIRVGPDGKLYVPIGAPCTICEPSDQYARIIRMDLNGSNVETVAVGVRNTLGFDWDPKTKDLWFTDNQRDWLSEDLPNDELNHVTKAGQHFGYPYCHQGDIADIEFGWGKDCSQYVKPAALLGPHSAPLGMRFYTGAHVSKAVSGRDLHCAARTLEPHEEVCR